MSHRNKNTSFESLDSDFDEDDFIDESYDDEYIFNKHPNSYDHQILTNDLYEYLNG